MDTKRPGDVRSKLWTCWKKHWPQFEVGVDLAVLGAARVDLTESIKQLLCTLTRESLCPYLSSTSYGSSLKQLKLILYISQSFHGER